MRPSHDDNPNRSCPPIRCLIDRRVPIEDLHQLSLDCYPLPKQCFDCRLSCHRAGLQAFSLLCSTVSHKSYSHIFTLVQLARVFPLNHHKSYMMIERGSCVTLLATPTPSGSAPACAQRVLHPPYHLLHGRSSLPQSIVLSTTNDDGFKYITNTAEPHPSTPYSQRWPGAYKIYEGPAPKHCRYRAPPPHLSIWQADNRERAAFHSGLLPPYAKHLAAPAISPLNEEEMKYALMEIDEAGEEERRHEAIAYPNWYRTPTSPKSRRTILPPQMTVSEAGLRLRLIRIASACSLFPQLGANMQDLLHKEIRAAMYREELALLSHLGRKNSATEPPSLDAQDHRGPWGTKRSFAASQGQVQSVEGVRKKMKIAMVNAPRPRPFTSRTVEDILDVQPSRDPPYMSDFMDEDEILERAWMESMTRRNHKSDLRKSLLLQSVVNAMNRPNTNTSRSVELLSAYTSAKLIKRYSNTDIIASIHNRNWRVHALVWDIEHETLSHRGRKEHAIRFASSWRRYRGQLPSPPPLSPP